MVSPIDGENSDVWNFVVCTLLPDIIKIVKSRRMRLAGHVACMKQK
jgi:hypothetical protein